MKHLKTILIALVTFGAFSIGHAQSKIAHISTRDLIQEMPAYQDAKSQLTKLKNSYSSQVDDMYKEAQKKSDQYKAEEPNQTDAENEKRMQDMQETRQRIMKFQQNAQEQMDQKQQDLMKPILDKAKNAIDKVAKKLGYDYVLDSSQGSGVLVADGHDLMPEVKKELGI